LTESKHLWILAGGNGAGKSTFYRLYLSKYGIKLVNADLIAKEIDSKSPENLSYHAAALASKMRRTNISFAGMGQADIRR